VDRSDGLLMEDVVFEVGGKFGGGDGVAVGVGLGSQSGNSSSGFNTILSFLSAAHSSTNVVG